MTKIIIKCGEAKQGSRENEWVRFGKGSDGKDYQVYSSYKDSKPYEIVYDIDADGFMRLPLDKAIVINDK